MIYISSKSYGKWEEIFQYHIIAAAILDRILHHCKTVNIKGKVISLKNVGSMVWRLCRSRDCF
ncbi:MAG: ATP-binding protein [Methanosarcinaceae archaeon]